jgi:hypothetical protein
MTFRAFFIGIVFALFIAGFGYVNDWILDLERFTSGHLIPVMVVGPILLFVMSLNLALRRLRSSWAFSGRELAVIFVLASAACCVPGRNLMEHFTQVLIMPHHWHRVTPGWRDRNLIQYFPPDTLVDPERSSEVMDGFITGLGVPEDRELPRGERTIRQIRRVPWRAWLPPLRNWLPMVLVGLVCYGCLALILHKQWSQHEHLAYPIAECVSAFITRRDGEGLPATMRNRSFWVGFAIVLAIRVNNGLCNWFPDVLIPVRLIYTFDPFIKLFPSVRLLWAGTGVFRFELFPLMVAFAFLLSSEISLTMGLSQIIWVSFAAPLAKMGVDFSTDYSGMGWSGWQRGGSYVAFALMLAYTGRNYYGGLLRSAFVRWRPAEGEGEEEMGAIWAMRLLLLAAAVLVLQVLRLGVSLPFAMATVFLGLLASVVVARISTETGLFFIHPRWQPFSFLLAMTGGYLMNPSVLVPTVMVCFMICIDQSQAYLPYLANGLRVCDRLRLPRTRLAGTTLAVCAAGVLLAVFIGLVATYNSGTPKQCSWSYTVLPKLPFQAVEPEVLKLQSVALLDEAETLPWYSRLRGIRPKPGFLGAAGFGFFGVILFSFLRLRLTRWPLHPVFFLVWATWPMHIFAYSILFGWLIKTFAVRFGGYSVVQRLKPFMFGVIGAEILGALIFMIVGGVYFLATGKPPIAYRYFPR